MAGTFRFELVTPEAMIIPKRGDDGKAAAAVEAEQVVVPGADGQFTVLAGHAPVISALRPGVLDIKLTTGLRRVFVRGGFAEVEPDRLTILAQHFVDLDSRDPKDQGKLATELKSAEAMLADAKDDATRLDARDAVDALKALGTFG